MKVRLKDTLGFDNYHMLILRTFGKFLSLWDIYVAFSATKFCLLLGKVVVVPVKGTGLVSKKLQIRVKHVEPVHKKG